MASWARKRSENVFAITGLAEFDAHGAEVVFGGGDGARFGDGGQNRRAPLDGRDEEESGCAGEVHADHEAVFPFEAGIGEGGDGRSGGQENGLRLRTFDCEGCGGGRQVFDESVVGDDEFVDVLGQLGGDFRFGVEQQTIRAAEDGGVGENSALGREEESVTALAGFEALDAIGREGVQQAGAILAGDFDLAAAGEVEPCRSVVQRFVAGCHGAAYWMGGGFSVIQRR